MALRPSQRVLLGQVVLFAGATIAVSVHPGFVLKRNEGGFSNYGIHIATAIPYSMAFVGASIGSLSAYRSFTARTRSGLDAILLSYGIICIAVLASTYPYKINHYFDDIHVGLGIAAMLFQLVASFVLAVLARRNYWALLVQIAGFVIGALTLETVLHWIFLSQVLSALGFGVLLVSATASRQNADFVGSRDQK